MKLTKSLIAFLLLLMVVPGCSMSPFSPKSQQKINNGNGKIDEIKSNQNGIIAELGKLKQDFDLVNSKLKEVQSGLLNINSAISRNENSGVQILQGDGSLILVFSILILGVMIWYRERAVRSEKSLSIIAAQVAKYNIAELNEDIIKSAVKGKQAQTVLKALSKSNI